MGKLWAVTPSPIVYCAVNMLVNRSCSAGDMSLVKKSARLEDPLYHTILKVPFLTSCLVQWYRLSMCLVFLSMTRLFVIPTAHSLSERFSVGPVCGKPNSSNVKCKGTPILTTSWHEGGRKMMWVIRTLKWSGLYYVATSMLSFRKKS